jgi:hypothetical protein
MTQRKIVFVVHTRKKGADMPRLTTVIFTSLAIQAAGLRATTPWPEACTAWHLAHAARISRQVPQTRLDMIGF